MIHRPPSALRQLAEAALPGVLLFALLVGDPPPPDAARWIMRAYAPLMLWALLRKVDADCRVLGVRVRRGRIPPFRPRDLAMQAALVALVALFAVAP